MNKIKRCKLVKAFLSHSSNDAGFVNAVVDNLRPGTYELDAQTFDRGLVNSQAIIKALEQSDLFCLLLSKDSVQAPYVQFETLLGLEFLAKGRFSQFLAICIDDESFDQANANVKFFNVVRKVTSPESTARLIQGHLLSAIADVKQQNHPFVGRAHEIADLETQISDQARPLVRSIFISGNAGSGRRTLARKFFEAQFPQVGKILPQIDIGAFDGLEELYRTILMKLRPSISASELKPRVAAFKVANIEEKRRQIAALLNSLLIGRESAILRDTGGLLTDTGGFAPEVSAVISHLQTRPHPPVIFISPRNIQKRFRRAENDIAYAETRALEWDTANRLISRLLKEKSVNVTPAQASELTKLSDCHPYNIYRIIEEVVDRGASAFLANTSGFIDWKHRHSSEYLSKTKLDQDDQLLLAVLTLIPQLDFETLVLALGRPDNIVSNTLQGLQNLHIIDSGDGQFQVAPALRTAVERDTRIKLPRSAMQSAIEKIATSLTIRIEAGSAPMTLLDAAIISAIQSNQARPEFSAAYVLPSHHVWLCKHYYDQGRWQDSIRHGREALAGTSRLSTNGFVAACRYICLAAARENEDDIFEEAISRLEKAAGDNWSKSNVAYLKGFALRNKGNLPAAEDFFSEAYDLSPGNSSASRELAAIALARGKLKEAEDLAREALAHAAANPFLLDIMIAVLIRKHGKNTGNITEVHSLFEALEKVGEESGRSFYTTRKAEFELLRGNTSEALSLIKQAVEKTPHLFEPRRLHAEILLKTGNTVKASEVLKIMNEMVEDRKVFDRMYNRRLYLETYSHYLLETGEFGRAKSLFTDKQIFTAAECDAAIREIEITEGYMRAAGR